MIDALLLVLSVLLSTAIWPLNRWARARGGTPAGTGLVLSLVGLAGGLVMALALGQPIYHPATFFVGALGGVAYSVGFVLLLLRCLTQGPIGPTVTAHGLGVAAPVAASLLMPFAADPSPQILAGLGGTVASVGLLALAPPLRAGAPPRRRWSLMLAAGWLLTGLAGAAQLVAARLAPEAAASTIIAQYLVSFLCLLVAASSAGAWPRGADFAAGAATGLVYAIVLPASYTAMKGMTAGLAYPATAALPALILLLAGALAWRERLTPWAWLGCILGIASTLLLTLPRFY